MSEYTNGLYKRLKELVEENSSLLHLGLGVCHRKLQSAINKKIEEVEKDFVNKANYYKKNVNDVAKEKAQLLKQYEDEFSKAYDAYSNKCYQYLVIKEQIELSRLSTIGNIITLLELKDKVEESQEYINYISKRRELEEKLNTIEVKADYDKTFEVLNALEDPKNQYDDQLAKYIEKYGNLCGLIEKIQEAVDVVADEGVEAISSISVTETAVVDESKASIMSKIKALVSNLFKKGNFEKDYLSKVNERVSAIDSEMVKIANQVKEDTITVVSVIIEQKDKINEAFAAE